MKLNKKLFFRNQKYFRRDIFGQGFLYRII